MSKKGKQRADLRSGSVKFVKLMKILFLLLTIVIVPVVMIMTALACNVKGLPCVILSVSVAVLVVFWLTVYGFYALRVSMGTVLGTEITAKVVHLHTNRKIFTYDVKMGCVAVKVRKNRFVCTFETQDSRDKFTFYRHAPFSKYSDGQFSADDVAAFCPEFEGEDFTRQRGDR